MKKVYFVEDVSNAPGRIYAVFANKEDANRFADMIEDGITSVEVVERTIFHGQLPVRGYNP